MSHADSNSALGDYTFIGGGLGNIASGERSAIVGGYDNTSSGSYSMIPGGSQNMANGSFSFAAGRRARAVQQGTFVWADSKDFNFSSWTADEFSARATGGVRFVTGIDVSGSPTAGAVLVAGGGSWSSISDRNLKENFEQVDGADVLAKIAALPISTWNYKAQDESIRHIGPMAQDVYAAFGLGEDDRHITTIDADGIALAAIQGLYQQNTEQKQEISELKAQMAEMQAMLQRLLAKGE